MRVFGTIFVVVAIGAFIPRAVGRETVGQLETVTERLIAGQIRELADHVVQLIDSAIRLGKSSTPPFMSPSDLIFLPG